MELAFELQARLPSVLHLELAGEKDLGAAGEGRGAFAARGILVVTLDGVDAAALVDLALVEGRQILVAPGAVGRAVVLDRQDEAHPLRIGAADARARVVAGVAGGGAAHAQKR